MDEEKEVNGYDGLYTITKDGQVFSYHKGTRFALKLSNTYYGYKMVALYDKSSVRKNYLVHRLVAIAYIPNPENKPQVNHINGIKHDNNINNLEWVTQLENIRHANKIGLFKNRKQPPCFRGGDNSQSVKVCMKDKDSNTIAEFASISTASICTGIDRGSISNCCLGNRKSAGGYIWSYSPTQNKQPN